ncbi:hypothetical protein B0H67DRAFT_129944 [Lasiosphaeris hirsuta]|uniref:Uncharacterized protein n=1 Tax=Lasiosphaeris hirsuta TaxID=260670 RepID=A0AA40B0I2_9PEZI|nr:hypothetical protein B0H67DRAFT_129944 [Lasiosphaeris hirsuta]
MDSASGPINCWGVTQISIVTVAGVVIVALMGLWLRWHLKLGKAEERAAMVLGQYDLLESQIGSYKNQIRALEDEVRRRDYFDIGSDDDDMTDDSSSCSVSSIQQSDRPEDLNQYSERASSPLPAVFEARAILPSEIRIVPVLRSPNSNHHPLSFGERLMRGENHNLPRHKSPDMPRDIPRGITHGRPVAEAVENPRENPFEGKQADTSENSGEPSSSRGPQSLPILAPVPLRAPCPIMPEHIEAPRPVTPEQLEAPRSISPERIEALCHRFSTPRLSNYRLGEGPGPRMVVTGNKGSPRSPLFSGALWAPNLSQTPSLSSTSVEPLPESEPAPLSPLGSPPDLSELGILDWDVSSDLDTPTLPDSRPSYEASAVP